MEFLLLVSVFVIATCGLVYELIAGTIASYLLGDSVTQFSTVIGCYLFAMGIGSWLSRYLNRNLLGHFIKIEIIIGVVGGCSAALLFFLFDFVHSFRFLLYFVVGIIGILVGVEIPLLLRILKDKVEFKDLVSKVFTFDYVGALFASVLFPLVMVPYLGLVKSSFLFGIFNILVAVWMLSLMKEEIPNIKFHKLAAYTSLICLMFGFIYSDHIMSITESNAYQGSIIYSKSTPYQRIVITRQSNDIRLFLNANLQFSSKDEYRYHEALVHPSLSAINNPKNALIIGGGDGLALREILKYPSIQHVTLVDLDPAMTKLFSSNEVLTNLNNNALQSDKLTIINQDAFLWLKEMALDHKKYDAVIIDVPDPSNFSVGKLYSLTFYRLLKKVLHEDSLVTIQSTSPLVARRSYWCINKTLQASGFATTPYHAYVPSFGEWGFVIASYKPFAPPEKYPDGLRYVSVQTAREMFNFPADMSEVDTKIQKLDDQILVHYFDEEWSDYLIY